MFWRCRDPEHPCFTPELAAQFGDCIEQCYRRCDKLVGDAARERMTKTRCSSCFQTMVAVPFAAPSISIPGFGSTACSRFKEVRSRVSELESSAIDWSKTYAYAIGLGGIYLNLRGRESAGIVTEGSESERVRKAIETGLACGHRSRCSSLRCRQCCCGGNESIRGPMSMKPPTC